jgi:hypothetical protein
MADAPLPANQAYYLDIGLGEWRGHFDFRLTDWAAYRRARLGALDRFLSLWMIGIFKLLPWAAITSRLAPEAGDGVRVRNHVRLHRLGLTLYVLDEVYTLDPDGSGVVVNALERFGPIPFLFRHRKRHTARVFDGGMRAVYSVPLLGDEWTADYLVHPDRLRIDSALTCAWAEAHERIRRQQPYVPQESYASSGG